MIYTEGSEGTHNGFTMLNLFLTQVRHVRLNENYTTAGDTRVTIRHLSTYKKEVGGKLDFPSG